MGLPSSSTMPVASAASRRPAPAADRPETKPAPPRFDPPVQAQPPGSGSPSGAGSPDSFVSRQRDADALATASPYASQAMNAEIKADVAAANDHIDQLDRDIDALGTSGGYVTDALRAERNGLAADVADYNAFINPDPIQPAGDGPAGDPGSGAIDPNPSNFEQVLDPLNSTGDEVRVDLTAGVGVTGKIFHGGVDGSLSASVEQTDDGYVIKVDREAALRLGLDVDGKKGDHGADANATIGAGGGVLIKYRFDTKEEAAQALKDLTLTAGDDPRAGHVAAGVENAADIAHGAAGIYDSVSDRALGFLTGGLIDNNPIGDFAEAATGVAERETNKGRAAVDAARSRLNAARDGQEYTVFIEGKIDGQLKGGAASKGLGLPDGLDVADLGLKLSGDASRRTQLTVDVDRDGNVSVAISQSGSLNGSVGVTGETTSVSGRASIEHEIDFKKNEDGRLVRQGSGDITINFSAQGTETNGDVVKSTSSAGGGFSYTIKAEDLNGHARQAVQQALDGDQAGALETLASVPGELKLNVDVSAGASIEHDIGSEKVKLSGGADRTYGTQATFIVDAQNGLNGDARRTATQIVNGDVEGGLETIGNIEGDLRVQNHRQTSGNLGFNVDTRAVDVSVNGKATATDRDDALNVEGITLRDGILISAGEARDFASQEADAASDQIQTVNDRIGDFIDDRIPGA